MSALHPWDAEMLTLLSARYGTTTGDAAQRHTGLSSFSRQRQSAAAYQVLLRLEAAGLVRRMDAERPVAWMLAAEAAKE